ncbi:MAG: CPBP family intramembrane glutamic endopeptidase [Planctomycetales bacterium]|jgi:membrane protease YdiL (CAAX protease family)
MPDEATESSQPDHLPVEGAVDEPHGRFFLITISTGAFAACVGVAFVGQLLTGVPAAGSLNRSDIFEPATWAAALTITLPMFALLYFERRTRIVWLRELWHLSSELLGPVVARVTFAELVVVSLFAGLGEELLFRGFLQSWLGGHGLLVALIVPNVLFGVLHWISRSYAICSFCIGLYFSCLLHFAESVNLTALIIAHSLYDLVALLCLAREMRQQYAAD